MSNSHLSNESGLVDSRDRQIDYLRLSLTDRCNFRCSYCFSPETKFVPHDALLTLEEQIDIVFLLCELGIRKVRLTGGEPLLRRGIDWLLRRLAEIDLLEEITLTTNGVLLPRYLDVLREAGVRRLNVSLDTLDPKRFSAITQRDQLREVQRAIELTRLAGIHVRINCVLLDRTTLAEAPGLVRYAQSIDADICFIEEMPMTSQYDHATVNVQQLQSCLHQVFELVPSAHRSNGPAQYLQLANLPTRIGFIAPLTHNFCADCNRIRLTARGELMLCLDQNKGIDLRAILRGDGNRKEALNNAITSAILQKPRGHKFENGYSLSRLMSAVGG